MAKVGEREKEVGVVGGACTSHAGGIVFYLPNRKTVQRKRVGGSVEECQSTLAIKVKLSNAALKRSARLKRALQRTAYAISVVVHLIIKCVGVGGGQR